jgi:hypothetical protein
MQYVYCAVGTETIHTVQVISSLEGVNSVQSKRSQNHTPFSCQYHYTMFRTNLYICTTPMNRKNELTIQRYRGKLESKVLSQKNSSRLCLV